MDPPPSPLARVGQVFWAVLLRRTRVIILLVSSFGIQNYVTTAVQRFLTPERVNTGNDDTVTGQEATVSVTTETQKWTGGDKRERENTEAEKKTREDRENVADACDSGFGHAVKDIEVRVTEKVIERGEILGNEPTTHRENETRGSQFTDERETEIYGTISKHVVQTVHVSRPSYFEERGRRDQGNKNEDYYQDKSDGEQNLTQGEEKTKDKDSGQLFSDGDGEEQTETKDRDRVREEHHAGLIRTGEVTIIGGAEEENEDLEEAIQKIVEDDEMDIETKDLRSKEGTKQTIQPKGNGEDGRKEFKLQIVSGAIGVGDENIKTVEIGRQEGVKEAPAINEKPKEKTEMVTSVTVSEKGELDNKDIGSDRDIMNSGGGKDKERYEEKEGTQQLLIVEQYGERSGSEEGKKDDREELAPEVESGGTEITHVERGEEKMHACDIKGDKSTGSQEAGQVGKAFNTRDEESGTERERGEEEPEENLGDEKTGTEFEGMEKEGSRQRADDDIKDQSECKGRKLETNRDDVGTILIEGAETGEEVNKVPVGEERVERTAATVGGEESEKFESETEIETGVMIENYVEGWRDVPTKEEKMHKTEREQNGNGAVGRQIEATNMDELCQTEVAVGNKENEMESIGLRNIETENRELKEIAEECGVVAREEEGKNSMDKGQEEETKAMIEEKQEHERHVIKENKEEPLVGQRDIGHNLDLAAETEAGAVDEEGDYEGGNDGEEGSLILKEKIGWERAEEVRKSEHAEEMEANKWGIEEKAEGIPVGRNGKCVLSEETQSGGERDSFTKETETDKDADENDLWLLSTGEDERITDIGRLHESNLREIIVVNKEEEQSEGEACSEDKDMESVEMKKAETEEKDINKEIERKDDEGISVEEQRKEGQFSETMTEGKQEDMGNDFDSAVDEAGAVDEEVDDAVGKKGEEEFMILKEGTGGRNTNEFGQLGYSGEIEADVWRTEEKRDGKEARPELMAPVPVGRNEKGVLSEETHLDLERDNFTKENDTDNDADEKDEGILGTGEDDRITEISRNEKNLREMIVENKEEEQREGEVCGADKDMESVEEKDINKSGGETEREKSIAEKEKIETVGQEEDIREEMEEEKGIKAPVEEVCHKGPLEQLVSEDGDELIREGWKEDVQREKRGESSNGVQVNVMLDGDRQERKDYEGMCVEEQGQFSELITEREQENMGKDLDSTVEIEDGAVEEEEEAKEEEEGMILKEESGGQNVIEVGESEYSANVWGTEEKRDEKELRAELMVPVAVERNDNGVLSEETHSDGERKEFTKKTETYNDADEKDTGILSTGEDERITDIGRNENDFREMIVESKEEEQSEGEACSEDKDMESVEMRKTETEEKDINKEKDIKDDEGISMEEQRKEGQFSETMTEGKQGDIGNYFDSTVEIEAGAVDEEVDDDVGKEGEEEFMILKDGTGGRNTKEFGQLGYSGEIEADVLGTEEKRDGKEARPELMAPVPVGRNEKGVLSEETHFDLERDNFTKENDTDNDADEKDEGILGTGEDDRITEISRNEKNLREMIVENKEEEQREGEVCGADKDMESVEEKDINKSGGETEREKSIAEKEKIETVGQEEDIREEMEEEKGIKAPVEEVCHKGPLEQLVSEDGDELIREGWKEDVQREKRGESSNGVQVNVMLDGDRQERKDYEGMCVEEQGQFSELITEREQENMGKDLDSTVEIEDGAVEEEEEAKEEEEGMILKEESGGQNVIEVGESEYSANVWGTEEKRDEKELRAELMVPVAVERNDNGVLSEETHSDGERKEFTKKTETYNDADEKDTGILSTGEDERITDIGRNENDFREMIVESKEEEQSEGEACSEDKDMESVEMRKTETEEKDINKEKDIKDDEGISMEEQRKEGQFSETMTEGKQGDIGNYFDSTVEIEAGAVDEEVDDDVGKEGEEEFMILKDGTGGRNTKEFGQLGYSGEIEADVWGTEEKRDGKEARPELMAPVPVGRTEKGVLSEETHLDVERDNFTKENDTDNDADEKDVGILGTGEDERITEISRNEKNLREMIVENKEEEQREGEVCGADKDMESVEEKDINKSGGETESEKSIAEKEKIETVGQEEDIREEMEEEKGIKAPVEEVCHKGPLEQLVSEDGDELIREGWKEDVQREKIGGSSDGVQVNVFDGDRQERKDYEGMCVEEQGQFSELITERERENMGKDFDSTVEIEDGAVEEEEESKEEEEGMMLKEETGGQNIIEVGESEYSANVWGTEEKRDEKELRAELMVPVTVERNDNGVLSEETHSDGERDQFTKKTETYNDADEKDTGILSSWEDERITDIGRNENNFREMIVESKEEEQSEGEACSEDKDMESVEMRKTETEEKDINKEKDIKDDEGISMEEQRKEGQFSETMTEGKQRDMGNDFDSTVEIEAGAVDEEVDDDVGKEGEEEFMILKDGTGGRNTKEFGQLGYSGEREADVWGTEEKRDGKEARPELMVPIPVGRNEKGVLSEETHLDLERDNFTKENDTDNDSDEKDVGILGTGEDDRITDMERNESNLREMIVENKEEEQREGEVCGADKDMESVKEKDINKSGGETEREKSIAETEKIETVGQEEEIREEMEEEKGIKAPVEKVCNKGALEQLFSEEGDELIKEGWKEDVQREKRRRSSNGVPVNVILRGDRQERKDYEGMCVEEQGQFSELITERKRENWEKHLDPMVEIKGGAVDEEEEAKEENEKEDEGMILKEETGGENTKEVRESEYSGEMQANVLGTEEKGDEIEGRPEEVRKVLISNREIHDAFGIEVARDNEEAELKGQEVESKEPERSSEVVKPTEIHWEKFDDRETEEKTIARLDNKETEGLNVEEENDEIKETTDNWIELHAPSLDFTAQRSRIALKNTHTRPPRNTRSLLNSPSLLPTPSQLQQPEQLNVVPMLVKQGGHIMTGFKLPGMGGEFPALKRTHRGVREGAGVTTENSKAPGAIMKVKSEREEVDGGQGVGMGVTGVKLPGLIGEFPGLRKTERGAKLREQTPEKNPPSQNNSTERSDTAGTDSIDGVKQIGFTVLRKTERGLRIRGAEDTQHCTQNSEVEVNIPGVDHQATLPKAKSKWTPPGKPGIGIGNPSMISELKNKLRKTE